MTDAWSARLSEYIDGELDMPTRRELEEHLRDCRSCRDELAGLHHVVARIDGAAPGGPSRDLWPALEGRLADAGREQPTPDVLSFRKSPPMRVGWAPLAAAAAFLFLGIVWLGSLAGPADVAGPQVAGSEVVTPQATEPVASVSPVDPVIRYTEVAASWRRLIDDLSLPAEIEASVRQDLVAFDRAANDARLALSESPNDAELERYLIHTLQAQVRFLSRLQASTEKLS